MSKAERHRQPTATDRPSPPTPPPGPAAPPPLPPQLAPPAIPPPPGPPAAPPPSPPILPTGTFALPTPLPSVAAPAATFPIIDTGPKPAAVSKPALITPAAPATAPARAPAAAGKPATKIAPAPVRPLSPAPRSAAAPAIAASEEEEHHDLSEEAVKNAPPFLISMLVHMVLVISLALFHLTNSQEQQVEISATYVDTRGQQLLDNSALQSPEAVNLTVDVPALSYGLVPVDDPFAAPPKLPDFLSSANQGNLNIEAPNIGYALTGREVGKKKALMAIYGATGATDGAVVAGLEWLKKQQQRDGGWSLVGPYPDGALGEDRCAATAMALLAFQGYGTTHQKNSALTPDFHDAVDRGWSFLLKLQDKDGFFQHDGSGQSRSYAQAQATIALCEIYGMTKDAKFKKPAQLALDYAHRAQSTEYGGWRYQPRVDSDTSVTGWYVMAFQSGLMAGLEVKSPNLELVNKFLDLVARDGGAQYAYLAGEPDPRLSMTAEGLLCRQYLGWKHDDERMRRGIDLILQNRIDYSGEQNIYYWYYATQACHHMEGDDWKKWNEALRREVPNAQVKTGGEKGSWPVSLNDRWAPNGGRLFVTSLSIFMLETYYRHLPIYKWKLQ